MSERDTYKYVFKVGNKIRYGGITEDLSGTRAPAEVAQGPYRSGWAKDHRGGGAGAKEGFRVEDENPDTEPTRLNTTLVPLRSTGDIQACTFAA